MSERSHKAVKIYREASWPPGAPSPSSLTSAGEQLLRAVNSALASSTARTLDTVVINANRRISVSIEEPKRRSARLRIHWLLIDDPRLPATIAKTLNEGRFPPTMRAIVENIRDRARPDHSYGTKGQKPRPRGQWIHLRRVLESVSRHLPDGGSIDELTIGWGKRSNKTRRRQRSIKLGSMVERERLIRVHPVLDDPWVPVFVIEYVVFHELCHYLAPPLSPSEARVRQEHRIHHRRFRELEDHYPDKAVAEAWIDEHLNILLKNANP